MIRHKVAVRYNKAMETQKSQGETREGVAADMISVISERSFDDS